MPSGPGRYDDVTTVVREMTGAACVVVVILGGARGNGFDQQIDARRRVVGVMIQRPGPVRGI